MTPANRRSSSHSTSSTQRPTPSLLELTLTYEAFKAVLAGYFGCFFHPPLLVQFTPADTRRRRRLAMALAPSSTNNNHRRPPLLKSRIQSFNQGASTNSSHTHPECIRKRHAHCTYCRGDERFRRRHHQRLDDVSRTE